MKFLRDLLHTHKWKPSFHHGITRSDAMYGHYKCRCGKVMVTKEYTNGHTFKKILR